MLGETCPLPAMVKTYTTSMNIDNSQNSGVPAGNPRSPYIADQTYGFSLQENALLDNPTTTIPTLAPN